MTDDKTASGVHSHESAVAEALARLEEDERELIYQIYYLGRTFEDIAGRTGRLTYRLSTLHNRAMRKLRCWLGPYVAERFGIPHLRPACPVCDSPYRREIDQIIANRNRTLTWKPVLARIRKKFGLDIQSPQRLMGHERFHMNELTGTPKKGGHK